jgi:hypothetical protein
VLLERLRIVECHHLGKTTPAWPTYNDLEQLRLDAAMLPAELGGGPDGYFHRHSFQTSSLFYRLADWLALSESDQLFNPFLLTFESGLKQAGSNLSHTLNGQSNSTQASPRSDSSLHGDAWSGKDGSKQQKPGLIEIAYSKAEGTQIPEEPSFPDNLLPQAQPIYQLLRHAHYSLTGYNGSGMSEVKAVELANRWIGQELSFEQASVIIHRLTSDWNSARNNIYSPIGVLIKRLEVALSLPALRTPDKPLPPTTSQTFSYSGNEARRPAFLNTFGRRRHHPFMPNHSSYSIKPFGREKSVGVGISPEQSAQTEPLEAYNPYQDVQSREKYCSGSSGFTGNEIELDKIWQQTLEKLAVNLPPMKFQLLDASRLELFLANELHPVLKLNRQWQLSQLGEVDLSIIRLTLRRFLGEQAWKLSFTSMESE